MADHKNSSFEIFGFDFIVDAGFKTWLIEVNTNPWLEESSKILQAYIPRMIDDALKLTIDVIFKRKIFTSSTDHTETNYLTSKNKRNMKDEHFHVHGYKDDENMWELLLSLT